MADRILSERIGCAHAIARDVPRTMPSAHLKIFCFDAGCVATLSRIRARIFRESGTGGKIVGWNPPAGFLADLVDVSRRYDTVAANGR